MDHPAHYFRVDYQDHQLPEEEKRRRNRIKTSLETQFQLWQTKEQQRQSSLTTLHFQVCLN